MNRLSEDEQDFMIKEPKNFDKYKGVNYNIPGSDIDYLSDTMQRTVALHQFLIMSTSKAIMPIIPGSLTKEIHFSINF